MTPPIYLAALLVLVGACAKESADQSAAPLTEDSTGRLPAAQVEAMAREAYLYGFGDITNPSGLTILDEEDWVTEATYSPWLSLKTSILLRNTSK